MADVCNVLFLCTGNSARSIMAEAAINHAAIGGGKFKGYSAGSHPKGTIHPLTFDTLRHNGIPIDMLRSKGWDEFARKDAPRLDVVITVCDQAAAEPCPVWPGKPTTAHWGIRDPAAVQGSEEEQRRAFRDAFLIIRRQIELFASLPLDKLPGLALKERLNQIGRQGSEILTRDD
jgi:arsenate reductase